MLSHAARAAIFDRRVYERITDEPEYMFRAVGIVGVAGVSFGLGRIALEVGDVDRVIVLVGTISKVFLGWMAWATIAYLLGTPLLHGRATHRMLLRSMGIAYGPGAFMVLIGIPQFGNYLFIVSLFWLLVAGAVAVRQTQNCGWMGAFFPSFVGWILGLWLLPAVLP